MKTIMSDVPKADSKKKNIIFEFFQKYWYLHVISIAFTIVAPLKIKKSDSMPLSILLYLAIECVALLIYFLKRYQCDMDDKINSLITLGESNEKKCAHKLDKIFTHFILGAGSGLDASINQAKNAGEVKWLVAKFLSEKLKGDFHPEPPRGEITFSGFPSSTEYIDFLELITSECSKSIYCINPYLPRRWFEIVLGRDCEKGVSTESILDKDWNDDCYKFLKGYAQSKVKENYRLSVFDEQTFNILVGNGSKTATIEDYKILEHFILINSLGEFPEDSSGKSPVSPFKLRFINVGNLTKRSDNLPKFFLRKKPSRRKIDSFEIRDLSIYDRIAALIWENQRDLKLKILVPEGDNGFSHIEIAREKKLLNAFLEDVGGGGEGVSKFSFSPEEVKALFLKNNPDLENEINANVVN